MAAARLASAAAGDVCPLATDAEARAKAAELGFIKRGFNAIPPVIAASIGLFIMGKDMGGIPGIPRGRPAKTERGRE